MAFSFTALVALRLGLLPPPSAASRLARSAP